MRNTFAVAGSSAPALTEFRGRMENPFRFPGRTVARTIALTCTSGPAALLRSRDCRRDPTSGKSCAARFPPLNALSYCSCANCARSATGPRRRSPGTCTWLRHRSRTTSTAAGSPKPGTSRSSTRSSTARRPRHRGPCPARCLFCWSSAKRHWRSTAAAVLSVLPKPLAARPPPSRSRQVRRPPSPSAAADRADPASGFRLCATAFRGLRHKQRCRSPSERGTGTSPHLLMPPGLRSGRSPRACPRVGQETPTS